MVESSKSFFPYLNLSFYLLFVSAANGAQLLHEKKVLSLPKLRWNRESYASSCLPKKSSRWENKGATILEIKHTGSCSSGTSTTSIDDRIKKLKEQLVLDETRTDWLQSRVAHKHSRPYKESEAGGNISSSGIPLTSGLSLQTLNYVVTVGLGGQNKTLIMDTGSDLTWVQCQPCSVCYNQQGPLFAPSSSSTYQPVPCTSPTCQSLRFSSGNPGFCNGSGCNYIVRYGDGSYTRGELGTEKLSLGSTTLDKFVFGCGRNNKGLFGKASGLIGLGRSQLSLVSQTQSLFGGVFSYCLPTTDAGASGSLVLGAGNTNSTLYKNTTPISYTRMIQTPQQPSFYFVNLTGISIGGVAISAPSLGQAGGGGVLFDSGTVITRLPPSVYKALKAEFLRQFSGFPSAPGFVILDTCFDLSKYQEIDVPTVRLHFEGDAELEVDLFGVFYIVKDDASQVCLAMASLSYEEEVAIIGNYQQRNQRVVYDTKESKLGVAPETCSFV